MLCKFAKIIRCTTLLPPFFSKIWGSILKKWLPIYDSKYCLPLATSFFQLSGNCRISSRQKRCVFWGDPWIDPFFDFFMRVKIRMSLALCHRSKQMVLVRSNIWRVRQNFPQITKIWLENWHLRSRMNLWCKHKFTNVVLSLYWQMFKLIVWHSWSAYFDQHLALQSSIEKWRKQSCTPSTHLS